MQEQARVDLDRKARAAASGRPRLSVLEAVRRPRAFSISRREGAWRDALLRRMLALSDLTAALAATISIAALGGAPVSAAAWGALFAPAWVVIAKLLGLYDRDQRTLRHLTVDELPTIFFWSVTCTAGFALFLAAAPPGWLDAGDALRLGLISAVAAVALRMLARSVWRRVTPPEATILIGQGPSLDGIRRKLELFPDIHATVVAERTALSEAELDDLPADLAEADRIILTSPAPDDAVIAALVAFCRLYQTKLSVVPSARGFFGTGVTLEHVADLPLLEYNTWDVSRSTQLLKRLLDVVVAAVALVVLLPLLVVLTITVLLDDGRPVFFAQVRAGQGARPFRILKFRTMVSDAERRLDEFVALSDLDEPMFKLRDDPRVTAVGRFLRRTSLDELPQLVNVLKGDMSLVGPRPEQLELVELYAPDHLFRLVVKPGLTGPMQVYGRAELTFAERLSVEREYVENISIGRDLHILALTFASLLHGRGAY